MLDYMKDLVDREVKRGEGGGVLGLRRCQGSVLLGSWGPMSPRALPHTSASCQLEGSRDPHMKQSR